MLAHKADPNAANSEGATALPWAAGDPEKVKLLVRAGADVKARSKIGRTPLIVAAASAGNLESVRLLVSKGADPTVTDQYGDGPVGSAAASAGESVRFRIQVWLFIIDPVAFLACRGGQRTCGTLACGLPQERHAHPCRYHLLFDHQAGVLRKSPQPVIAIQTADYGWLS
jgi:hypothetical protein